jgi:dihydrofolate reductase
MGRLVYAAIASLDGYVADVNGDFTWCAPDEEVHAAVNDLERGIGTQVLGRRMYDVLAFWDTVDTGPDQAPVMRDFARIWRSTDKIVHSRTLTAVTAGRTRLERGLDLGALRELVRTSPADVSIGGPTLAAPALRAGLVDDVHLFLSPVLVGGGLRALPDDVRLDLELVEERRFTNGVVHLHYRSRRST